MATPESAWFQSARAEASYSTDDMTTKPMTACIQFRALTRRGDVARTKASAATAPPEMTAFQAGSLGS